MLKSRTIAIAGTIGALSLAGAPLAAAAGSTHAGKASPNRVERVDKKSPDKTGSRESKHRFDNTRDAKNHR